jgi:hypothetical protein
MNAMKTPLELKVEVPKSVLAFCIIAAKRIEYPEDINVKSN